MTSVIGALILTGARLRNHEERTLMPHGVLTSVRTQSDGITYKVAASSKSRTAALHPLEHRSRAVWMSA